MKRKMGFGKQIIKPVAVVTLVMLMGFTACSQKNSIDSGSVETSSVETPTDEDDKIEISMEDVIAIGKDEAAKYYDDLQLTNVYSYDNDYDRNVMSGDDGKREWWYVNFAHIDFDATTGELLLAEEEIEYSNGDVEWKSFN